MKSIFASILSLFGMHAFAQFAPPALQVGTSAMHKDSSAFVYWLGNGDAETVIHRGYQDISNTSLGVANVGDSSLSYEKAGENGAVSLGDGGVATIRLHGNYPAFIYNGEGYDFAIFENSFSDDFLELAFVEVSSDGVNYFRFPATSNTDTTVQIGTYGLTDATKINNLAGKYRALYGTPFDLEELKSEAGLDVNHINYIKIIDVVGSMQSAYASRDQYGHKINDPWPTAFGSSGFDLDAVGFINGLTEGVDELTQSTIRMYPNPILIGENLNLINANGKLTLVNMEGKEVYAEMINESAHTISLPFLNSGIYLVKVVNEKSISTQKLLIR